MSGRMEQIKNTFSLSRTDRWIYILLLAIAFTNVLSDIFARNLVRVLLLVVAIRILLWRGEAFPQGYFQRYKNFALSMGGFSLILVFSAFMGGDVLHGLTSGNTFWFNFCNMFLVFIVGMCMLTEDRLLHIFEAVMVSMLLTDVYMYVQAIQGTARASGFYRSYAVTTIGIVLDSLLPVMLLMCMGKNEKWKKHRRFYEVAFLASVFGLLVNGTRGAWLALLPVLFVLVVLYGKKRKRILMVMVGVFCVGAFVLNAAPWLHQRVVSVSDMQEQAHTERVRIWTGAFHMIEDYPLLGVGLGNYPEQYQHKYILPEAKERDISHAHNNFLMICAENGIIGLTVFCSMFLFFMYWAWQRRSSSYAVMILAMTVAILLHGLVDYIYAGHSGLRLYWLLLGLCIRGAELENQNKRLQGGI